MDFRACGGLQHQIGPARLTFGEVSYKVPNKGGPLSLRAILPVIAHPDNGASVPSLAESLHACKRG